MKHQYFGDINDFRKFGLLRVLTKAGAKRLGIFWMLTPDDGRTDGNFIRYLTEPLRWRDTDPALFDTLATGVVGQRRVISAPLLERILPNTKFASNVIADGAEDRRRVFADTLMRFNDCDLIFIDPDNGLEVSSKPKGTRGSNKYLYWDEVGEFSRLGSSLLIYQHFPRKERTSFTMSLSARLRDVTGASEVHAFATSNVLFLLAPSVGEEEWYRERSAIANQSWTLHFTHTIATPTADVREGQRFS